ncbi:MAG: ImmA/IrrE family metallo-endopeptidase [Phycisphaerales bacterium]
MTDRLAVAREAMRAAFQVRRQLSIPRETPVNPFDISQALGVEVWFLDTPSLEGMFSRSPDPRIVLPSWNHRPFGRVCFSCAHELGHAQLNHGTKMDEYVDGERSANDPQEMAADVFASSLLMPRPAIIRAFERRGVSPSQAAELQLLTIAFELAVGFETLVKHLRWGLELIDTPIMTRYLKRTPKQIRQTAFGSAVPAVVVPVEACAEAPSIDLEVGQAVATPTGVLGPGAGMPVLGEATVSNGWDIRSAERSGTCLVELGDRRVPIRVAKTAYVGAWQNRFLDDPEAP